MDKCPKCGNKLSSIDVLCPKCGALVEVVQILKGPGMPSVSVSCEAPARRMLQENLIVDDWPVDDAACAPVPESAEAAAPTPAPDEDGTLADPESGTAETYRSLLKMMNLPELETIGGEVETVDPHAADFDAVQPPAAAFDTVPGAMPSPAAAPVFSAAEGFSAAEVFSAAEEFPTAEGFSAAEGFPATEGLSAAAESSPQRWLELEEIAEAAPTHAAAAAAVPAPQSDYSADHFSDAATFAAPPAYAPPAPAEYGEARRYRADHKSRVAGKRSREASAPKRGTGRVLLTVLMWLAICGVFFYGFFYLDRYVTDRYGSYQALLYEITDGTLGGAPR